MLSLMVACLLEEMEVDTGIPIMENQSFSIGSDAIKDQIIGTVEAQNADSYRITAGNSGNVFNLNRSNGLLWVATASALSVTEYALTVLVSNVSSSHTASAMVTVRVTNSGGSEGDNYQPPSTNWLLSWSDEFNGSTIDSSIWTHEMGNHGWGNSELQHYTDSPNNSYIEDGKLVIKAIRSNNAYTSARMISENKFSFKYGLVVARMQAPYGQGVWPAIWMLGGQDDTNAGWPYDWPQCGEIDIFEMFGNGEDNDKRTTGAMHWESTNSIRSGCYSAYGNHRGCGYHLNTGSRLANAFHYYSLEWNESQLTWRFDGQVFATADISDEEFDEFRATKFFLLLNIAVGGNPVPAPDTSFFPQTMTIDWIRVYTNINGTAGPFDEGIGGAGKIFADANSLSNVQQIALSGEILKSAHNGGGGSFTLTRPHGGGAGGSSQYLTFTERSANAAGDWALIIWTFKDLYNMEAVSNTSFSFYVRSSQVGSIRAKLEDVNSGGSIGSAEVEKTFSAGGGWQQVSFSASEFSATDLTYIKKVVIVVPTGESEGALTMDFDEVQFMEP